MRPFGVTSWPGAAFVALVLACAGCDHGEKPPPTRIIHTGEGEGWLSGALPELTGEAPYPVWDAFDQDSETFLYVAPGGGVGSEVFVVGEDGPIADFACHPEVVCGQIDAFGPGAGEVTLPESSSTSMTSVRIVGFDGTLRDTIDIDHPGQALEDLAWSPDGSRLAVSTDSACNVRPVPCDGKVWVLNRAGGHRRLVYTERASEDATARMNTPPALGNLAWSPDGRRLALLVVPALPRNVVAKSVRPRLVVLRSLASDSVRADTLHAFDYCCHRRRIMLSDHHIHFAFAWSPDGTRIAVTGKDGIAELSAEDGRVLARHPGRDLHGPLAWLR